MTPNLSEKIDFLRDLDDICAKHLESNKHNMAMKAYITEFENQIQDELEPLEQENDYYADKYAPTPADIED